jgi:tetratricopeptide (TPR) repeat protein
MVMCRFSAKDQARKMIVRADRARDAGQWSLAARLYRKALGRFPPNPPIWVQYGHALKESGFQAQAEAAYRTAIRYDPSDADVHLQLGHVLKLQGRRADAEAAYLLAAALDPSSSEPVRELGGLGWLEPALSELKPVASDPIAGATPGPANSTGQANVSSRGRSSGETERLLEALCEVERRAQGLEVVPARMQSEIAALRDDLSRMVRQPAAMSADAALRE